MEVNWKQQKDGIITGLPLTHRYQKAGEYVLRFLPQEDNMVMFMGSYSRGLMFYSRKEK